MRLNRQQIHERAMEVLEASQQGVRWSDLVRQVAANASDTPLNSIDGGIHVLLKTRTSEISKVARGTYRLTKFIDVDNAASSAEEPAIITMLVKSEAPDAGTLTEQDFYASFATWLQDNDEATSAVVLGGSSLGGKWGTPDVIGVLRSRAQDIFKFEPRIVAAEIKVVPNQPVVAFGQAVAYRLFSHTSYIVVPRTTGSDDMGRLTALCSIHGIGLVTFALDREQPNYAVVVLPVSATPDVFYLNTMLDRLKSTDSATLNRLFS